MSNIGEPEQHNIYQLNYFHKNPRIGDTEAIALSLETNGAYKPIVVNRGTYTGRPMEVLAGNHRLKAQKLLVERGETQWETIETWMVDVDDEKATRIVLADNRTADLGTYDNDDVLELLGSLNDGTEGTGYDPGYIDALLGGNIPDDGLPSLDEPTDADDEELQDPRELKKEEIKNLKEKYTKKIQAPHYTPTKDTPPALADIYDTTKTDELIHNIQNSNLPPDVQQFLIAAAHRHTKIDFQQAAEYYAHADAETQQLMEEQALVIIDIDSAIRNGYVKLSKQLTQIITEEHGQQHGY